MKLKTKATIVLLAASAMLLSACVVQQDPLPPRPHSVALPSHDNTVNVYNSHGARQTIYDNYMDYALAVGEPNRSYVSGNLLKVQVPIKNTSASQIYLHYQIVWFDADGSELTDTQPVWMQLNILSGDSATLKAVATNPKAVDFKIKITRSAYER